MKEFLLMILIGLMIIISTSAIYNINKTIEDLDKSKKTELSLINEVAKYKLDNESYSTVIISQQEKIDSLKNIISNLTDSNSYKEVYFTSYYENDNCGSSDTTGSGLKTSDFDVNEKGWYVYQGKVVIAAATWEGIHSKSKWIKNKVPRSFLVYSYYDETQIIVDGIKYNAIILDTCGASYWEEDRQRIDIFVVDKSAALGKIVGLIKE